MPEIAKAVLGMLILAAGCIFCIAVAVTLGPSTRDKPKSLPVLKADFHGKVLNTNYELKRVDMPDGSWHVVAFPK